VAGTPRYFSIVKCASSSLCIRTLVLLHSYAQELFFPTETNFGCTLTRTKLADLGVEDRCSLVCKNKLVKIRKKVLKNQIGQKKGENNTKNIQLVIKKGQIIRNCHLAVSDVTARHVISSLKRFTGTVRTHSRNCRNKYEKATRILSII
jgi:hypothetical protein